MKIMMSRDELLNSKSEYVRNCLTCITISETDWERREREKLEENLEKVEAEKLEEFIRVKASYQVSNQLVVEEPSCLEEEVVKDRQHQEESNEMDSKRRKLDVCVRVRVKSGYLTHHHDFDLRRWWKRLEQVEPVRRVEITTKKKVSSKMKPTAMNLAWFSYWWKRMDRQAAAEQELKTEMKTQKKCAQSLACFLMSGKTQPSQKPLQDRDKETASSTNLLLEESESTVD